MTDPLMEWLDNAETNDETTLSYRAAEEAVATGEWEWDHRREYIYPSEEVAWLEYFTIDSLGNQYQATCRNCRAVYVRPKRADAIQTVRVHVQRGCDTQPRATYTLPKECPF